MAKKYLKVVVLITFLLVSSFGYSQVIEAKISSYIEGLAIFPNPASNGKLYVTTKKNSLKKIEIFDVLGKRVHSSSLMGTALDISMLNSGVYVIKIEEGQDTETRKLVVR